MLGATFRPPALTPARPRGSPEKPGAFSIQVLRPAGVFPDRKPAVRGKVGSGRERRVLRGHRGQVHALAFFPDGRTLASASGDSTDLVWGLTARRPGD